MASDGRITESVRRMMLLYLILITAIDNVMMKSGLRFYTFRTILCSAIVYFKYNYTKWWLEAVQDEHNRKLNVYMCNLSIPAAKNIK